MIKNKTKKKHLNIFFSRTKKALSLNLGVWHLGLKVCEVCSNDDHRLTFDFFYSKVKFASPYICEGKMFEKSFSQNV